MDLRRSWRDWLGDAGLTATAALLGVMLLQATIEDPAPGQEILVGPDLVAGAVSLVVLLLFRRRYPVAVAVTMMFAQWTGTTVHGTSAVAMYSLAMLRPWRMSLPIAAANLALIIGIFRVAAPTAEFLEGAVVFALMHAALVTTGMLVRSRRQLIASLQERARAAETEQRLRVEEARLLERERIAREMHDVLAHRISLLAVHAGALEFRPDAPAEQREAAGVIRRSAYEAMEDLRDVIGVLRDEAPDADPERPQPTLADVPDLVRESRRAGADVTLEGRTPGPEAVPTRVGRHAYRIVQEGLTNARKHAPGMPVRVTVDAGTELAVEIVNAVPPGPPAPPLPGSGAGLVGLAERVALVGGTLEHGRTADGGFRLRARLPLRTTAADHDGARPGRAWAARRAGKVRDMAANSTDRPVLEELDRAECLRLVAGGSIGRVAFDDGEGPTVIPVNYALDGDAVIFRTSASGRMNRSLLSGVAGGEIRAAFQVDRFDETDRLGWSVLLRGGTHPLSDEEKERVVQVDPWPGDERTEWFRLAAKEVTGRRLRRP